MKVLDNSTWIQQQFGGCELADPRRTERLCYVAHRMLDAPDKSLQTQNVQWTDLKAAYRLFDRPEVSFDAVAEWHWQQTREQLPERCLLICDTTDIDHFNHRATTGLSQLGKGDGRGMQLHNCLMVDASNGHVLGQAGAVLNYRPKAPKKETRMQRLNRYRESEIWGDLVEEVGTPPPNRQWIHVWDRGGDQYEAMCHLKQNNCDWVIRAAKLQRNVVTTDGQTMPFKQALSSAQVLGTYQLQLRARPGQSARCAKLQVSTLQVTYPTPRHVSPFVKACGIDSIGVNVVVVQEIDAPDGVAPIYWVLQTSLPVTSLDDAWDVVTYYEHRWLIEEYHKVLKTGCSIERHSLRTAERLEPLIGLISVIGVRLLQLKTIGRDEPTVRAKQRIPDSWLRALKALRPRIAIGTLTVYNFFRELAKLGGFLGRKHDGEPGWQTIWRGYHKLHSTMLGMALERNKKLNTCG